MPLKKENSADLKISTNEHIIALMRVNHSGEVCAQDFIQDNPYLHLMKNL